MLNLSLTRLSLIHEDSWLHSNRIYFKTLNTIKWSDSVVKKCYDIYPISKLTRHFWDDRISIIWFYDQE